MTGENETVAKVIDDFTYLITLGSIGPNVATDIRNRIEAAHKREVAELRERFQKLLQPIVSCKIMGCTRGYARGYCQPVDAVREVKRLLKEGVAK